MPLRLFVSTNERLMLKDAISLHEIEVDFATPGACAEAMKLLDISVERNLVEIRDTSSRKVVARSEPLRAFRRLAAATPGTCLWAGERSRQFRSELKSCSFEFAGFRVDFSGRTSLDYRRAPTRNRIMFSISEHGSQIGAGFLDEYLNSVEARLDRSFRNRFPAANAAWDALQARERPVPSCPRLLDQLFEATAAAAAIGSDALAPRSATLKPEPGMIEWREIITDAIRHDASSKGRGHRADMSQWHDDREALLAAYGHEHDCCGWESLEFALKGLSRCIDRSRVLAEAQSEFCCQASFLGHWLAKRQAGSWTDNYAPWSEAGAVTSDRGEDAAHFKLYFARPAALALELRCAELASAAPEHLVALARLSSCDTWEVRKCVDWNESLAERSPVLQRMLDDAAPGTALWRFRQFELLAGRCGLETLKLTEEISLSSEVVAPLFDKVTKSDGTLRQQLIVGGSKHQIPRSKFLSSTGSRLTKSFASFSGIPADRLDEAISWLTERLTLFESEAARVRSTQPAPPQGSTAAAAVREMVADFLGASLAVGDGTHRGCCNGDMEVTELAIRRCGATLTAEALAELRREGCDCRVAYGE